MSHELELFDDNSAAFVTARKPGWHLLGTVLDECFTAEQGLKIGQLDWPVYRYPLTAVEPETLLNSDTIPTVLDVPRYYATVRDHPKLGKQVLGVVGNKYVPVQNSEAFQILNNIVDESGAIFETAGSLRGGRQVFMTMRLPQHITFGDGTDPHEWYIVCINSHDGSTALRIITTMVRVVCANTAQFALNSAKSTINIRHTRSATERIQEARKALDLVFTYQGAMEQDINTMLEKVYTDVMFEQLTEKLLPTPHEPKLAIERNEEYKAQLKQLFTADTQKPIANTGYAAFSAVTEWADWYAPVKSKDKVTARAERLISGGNEDIKQRAYDLIMN